MACTDNAFRELSLLRAVEPIKNGTICCILLHGLSLTGGHIAIDEVDRLARSLSFFLFLNVLFIALDVYFEVLKQAISLLIVVGLVVRPMTVERETKVRDLEVARCGYEEIIGLDITMNPVHLVRFFDAQDHLGDILLRHILVKYVLPQKQAKEVTPHHVLHNEVEVIVILERCNKRYNPA